MASKMLAYDNMECKYRRFRYVYGGNQDSFTSKLSDGDQRICTNDQEIL